MALITLTSDFGLQDYIAGAVKGQLMLYMPKCDLAFPGKYLSYHFGKHV